MHVLDNSTIVQAILICMDIVFLSQVSYYLFLMAAYAHAYTHTQSKKKSKVFSCHRVVTRSSLAGVPVH